MPSLLSVNAGLPRDVTWNGKTVRTSVWKSSVDGRRMVRKPNIQGDAQADLLEQEGQYGKCLDCAEEIGQPQLRSRCPSLNQGIELRFSDQ